MCLSFENRKPIAYSTILCTLDYGDILYAHDAATMLKPLKLLPQTIIIIITMSHTKRSDGQPGINITSSSSVRPYYLSC